MIDKDLLCLVYEELLQLRDELYTVYNKNLSASEQNLQYYLKL